MRYLWLLIAIVGLFMWGTTDIEALERVKIDRSEWDFSTSISTSIPGVEFHHRSSLDGEANCSGLTHTIELAGKPYKVIYERCEGDDDTSATIIDTSRFEGERHAS